MEVLARVEQELPFVCRHFAHLVAAERAGTIIKRRLISFLAGIGVSEFIV